jgi:hypothetical protein
MFALGAIVMFSHMKFEHRWSTMQFSQLETILLLELPFK